MCLARFIEPEERRRLLQELKSPRDRLLAILGLNTGLRVGSILSLRWKLLLWQGEITPTMEVPRRHLKGGRGQHKRAVVGRRVPVNEALRSAIGDYLRDEYGDTVPDGEEWVFRSRKRFPGVISRQQAHAVITSAAKRAGLGPGIAPHGLRRTFAGEIYEASGHDLLAVQKLLGHASVETTALYLKPNQDQLDQLVRGLPFRQAGPGPVEEVVGQVRISGT
jgi:integrase